MSNRLAAWIGWPGSGPAPGHDWLPGPKLRFTILGLTYAFLALALTVNYAYSTAFFLLALIGLYVGFRRGFVNGLTRAERLVMLAFAAYVGVAIASYLLGTQTNIGFRFLGRDLRFLLFIPVYLAIRRARPQARHIGWALAGGAVADLIMALIQHQPWPAPMPHGVTGTHITFGDLSILSGFLAAALLMPLGRRVPAAKAPRGIAWAGATVGLLAGVGAGVLAGARGGWLALPFLVFVLVHYGAYGRKKKINKLAISTFILLILLLVLLGFPGTRHRLSSAFNQLHAYIAAVSVSHKKDACIGRQLLTIVLGHGVLQGIGAHAAVVGLNKRQHAAAARYGCPASSAIEIRAGNAAPAFLVLYRQMISGSRQALQIIAEGDGWIKMGWHGRGQKIAANTLMSYSAPAQFDDGQPLVLVVPHGKHLLFFPIQQGEEYIKVLKQSSIGNRLSMWRVAWSIFEAHPIFGSGTGAYDAQTESYISSGVAPSSIKGFQHAHNDYLTALATKGVFGIVALLALFLTPLGVSIIIGRSRNVRNKMTALSMAAMLIFSLTESMLVHSLVISWYVVAVSALLSLTFASER